MKTTQRTIGHLIPVTASQAPALCSGFEEKARDILQHAQAGNTTKAYKADLAHFIAWGGEIPASPELVSAYLITYAGDLRSSTLERRLSAIRQEHKMAGFKTPTESEKVSKTMKAIRRATGNAPRRVKALALEDLVVILAACEGDGLKGTRDAALLTFGLALGARCSELLALTVADLEEVAEGFRVTVRRSKTDQEGEGRTVAVPQGGRVCPVRTLKEWLQAAGIESGPLFRAVDRHGNVGASLTRQAVAAIIKARAKAAGLDPAKVSTHSLRAGLVTEAARAGVPLHKIMEQTGHRCSDTVLKYVRDARIFEQNAAGAIFNR